MNFLLVIFVGIVIRIIAILISPEIADVKNFHLAGELFLKTGSIYQYTQGLNPYPPLWIFYEAFSAFLSKYLNFPFVYIEKLPILLSDIGIFYLLGKLTKDKGSFVFYLFNPVVIFTGSILGQFDPIVIFFLFLAYVFFIKKKSLVRSGFFLSLSICLKTYPIIMVPLFLSKINRLKGKIIFTFSSLALFVFITIHPLLTDFKNIQETYLGYKGAADFGWLGSIKTISALISGTSINFTPINNNLSFFLDISKYCFIIFYLILLQKNIKVKKNLLHMIVQTFLLFYIIIGGVGVQYFFWIIPFLLIYDKKQIKIYSVLSSLAMIGYVGVQFYYPILRYYNLFIFKNPFYLNFIYLLVITVFWIYLIALFFYLCRTSAK